MFKAIGLLITLWGLSHFFSSAFVAFEDAAVATFNSLETAAAVFETNLQEID